MDYTWDEAKRAESLRKHHLDFLDADMIYEAPHKLTVPATCQSDREPRWADFAEVYGVVLKLVYTLRQRDVVARFKTQGKGYQARINAVFRAYMEAQKARSDTRP
jgi:uncharacterized DUF497 family protein